jgi:hypothetical protein
MKYWVVAAVLTVPMWADFGRMDVETVFRRSIETYQVNWQAAPEYDFVERDRSSSGETKTYHLGMVYGSPYRMLVAVNGVPLSPDQGADEQRKLEEATAQRRREAPQKRAERVTKHEEERHYELQLLGESVHAFDLRLLGEEQLGQYRVYVIQVSPRPGYCPASVGNGESVLPLR